MSKKQFDLGDNQKIGREMEELGKIVGELREGESGANNETRVANREKRFARRKNNELLRKLKERKKFLEAEVKNGRLSQASGRLEAVDDIIKEVEAQKVKNKQNLLDRLEKRKNFLEKEDNPSEGRLKAVEDIIKSIKDNDKREDESDIKEQPAGLEKNRQGNFSQASGRVGSADDNGTNKKIEENFGAEGRTVDNGEADEDKSHVHQKGGETLYERIAQNDGRISINIDVKGATSHSSVNIGQEPSAAAGQDVPERKEDGNKGGNEGNEDKPEISPQINNEMPADDSGGSGPEKLGQREEGEGSRSPDPVSDPTGEKPEGGPEKPEEDKNEAGKEEKNKKEEEKPDAGDSPEKDDAVASKKMYSDDNLPLRDILAQARADVLAEKKKEERNFLAWEEIKHNEELMDKITDILKELAYSGKIKDLQELPELCGLEPKELEEIIEEERALLRQQAEQEVKKGKSWKKYTKKAAGYIGAAGALVALERFSAVFGLTGSVALSGTRIIDNYVTAKKDKKKLEKIYKKLTLNLREGLKIKRDIEKKVKLGGDRKKLESELSREGKKLLAFAERMQDHFSARLAIKSQEKLQQDFFSLCDETACLLPERELKEVLGKFLKKKEFENIGQKQKKEVIDLLLHLNDIDVKQDKLKKKMVSRWGKHWQGIKEKFRYFAEKAGLEEGSAREKALTSLVFSAAGYLAAEAPVLRQAFYGYAGVKMGDMAAQFYINRKESKRQNKEESIKSILKEWEKFKESPDKKDVDSAQDILQRLSVFAFDEELARRDPHCYYEIQKIIDEINEFLLKNLENSDDYVEIYNKKVSQKIKEKKKIKWTNSFIRATGMVLGGAAGVLLGKGGTEYIEQKFSEYEHRSAEEIKHLKTMAEEAMKNGHHVAGGSHHHLKEAAKNIHSHTAAVKSPSAATHLHNKAAVPDANHHHAAAAKSNSSHSTAVQQNQAASQQHHSSVNQPAVGHHHAAAANKPSGSPAHSISAAKNQLPNHSHQPAQGSKLMPAVGSKVNNPGGAKHEALKQIFPQNLNNFHHNLKRGDSLWSAADKYLRLSKSHFNSLGHNPSQQEALQTYNIDRLKDKIVSLLKHGNPAELKKYGLAGIHNPDKVTLKQLKGINFHALAIDTFGHTHHLTEHLSAAQVKSIDHHNEVLRNYFQHHPQASRSSAHYEEILRGNGAAASGHISAAEQASHLAKNQMAANAPAAKNIFSPEKLPPITEFSHWSGAEQYNFIKELREQKMILSQELQSAFYHHNASLAKKISEQMQHLNKVEHNFWHVYQGEHQNEISRYYTLEKIFQQKNQHLIKEAAEVVNQRLGEEYCGYRFWFGWDQQQWDKILNLNAHKLIASHNYYLKHRNLLPEKFSNDLIYKIKAALGEPRPGETIKEYLQRFEEQRLAKISGLGSLKGQLNELAGKLGWLPAGSNEDLATQVLQSSGGEVDLKIIK